MSTFTLRKFTIPATLRSVRRDHLLALLGQYRAYFAGRGVVLAPVARALRLVEAGGGSGRLAESAEEALDYDGIARVLMTPDETTPRELVDDLFHVDAMATPEGMDELLAAVEQLPPARRRALDLDEAPTPADVAVVVRLHAPELLELKHAEAQVTSKRSFQHFLAARGGAPFAAPSEAQLRALEAELDDALAALKRGRTSKVFVFVQGDEAWMLIRHGDPCKREGAVEATGTSCVYYRPEVFDVLRYDPAVGELSVSAGTCKRLYSLYRESVGRHLFGDALRFPAGAPTFTLEPLRTDGEAALVCADVEGMEAVVLRELHLYWGGPEQEVETRRASDLFAAYRRRGRLIPASARLMKAKFEVRFSDSRITRMVTITSANVTTFTRDADAAVVEEWMTRRGFALAGKRADA